MHLVPGDSALLSYVVLNQAFTQLRYPTESNVQDFEYKGMCDESSGIFRILGRLFFTVSKSFSSVFLFSFKVFPSVTPRQSVDRDRFSYVSDALTFFPIALISFL